MKNYVIESYENYREEDRLSTNNARRIEFLTTVKVLDELINGKKTILDCAAGTGIYSFYFADKGHVVTATDITPRHIEVMRGILKNKPYKMETAVLDATDMNIFEDESFDIVLNMGPFYHLVNACDREKCMKESLRVLKKAVSLLRLTFQDTMFSNMWLCRIRTFWMRSLPGRLFRQASCITMMRNAFGRIHIILHVKKWSNCTNDITSL